MSDPNNPFAGLVGASDVAPGVDTSHNDENPSPQSTKRSKEDEESEAINNIVENVFHFTINPRSAEKFATSDNQLVYLEDLAEATKPGKNIDLGALEQGLFERLLLTDIESCVIPKSRKVYKEHVVQKQVFPYLFNSMQNLQSYDNTTVDYVKNGIQRMRELIFRNAVTALKQPALFEDQDFSKQLVELLQHIDPQSHSFFVDVVQAFMADGKFTFFSSMSLC